MRDARSVTLEIGIEAKDVVSVTMGDGPLVMVAQSSCSRSNSFSLSREVTFSFGRSTCLSSVSRLCSHLEHCSLQPYFLPSLYSCSKSLLNLAHQRDAAVPERGQ